MMDRVKSRYGGPLERSLEIDSETTSYMHYVHSYLEHFHLLTCLLHAAGILSYWMAP